MSNQLISLLQSWYPQRDAADWVLGTVYKTEGPCYRKAGAMMLLGSQGQQLGMLSGGCLESDIHRHSRQVMLSGRAKTLMYDGSDEDDLAFQLGIGCGGRVHILLQPVTAANAYLQLPEMLETLGARCRGVYFQQIPVSPEAESGCRFVADSAAARTAAQITAQSSHKNSPRTSPSAQQLASMPVPVPARLISEQGVEWLRTRVAPPPHLLIIGGGVDARPLAAMAQTLGWQLTLWDPRPAHGRAEHFPGVQQRLSGSLDELRAYIQQQPLNAAVLMSHNLELDARALLALKDTAMDYLALLGPLNRKTDVLAEAGLTEAELATPLTGPAGLDLGAQLPETIALSILAECQAVIGQGSSRSLNQPARGCQELGQLSVKGVQYRL